MFTHLAPIVQNLMDLSPTKGYSPDTRDPTSPPLSLFLTPVFFE